MEIRDNEKICIFTPLSPILNKYETERLFKNVNSEKQREIGIDLSYVSDCTIDFVTKLKEFTPKLKIGIFNIPSDVFVIFNVMNVDKCVKLYASELDFETDKHRIVNRHFSVI